MGDSEDENRASRERKGISHPLFSCQPATASASSGIQNASDQSLTESANSGILDPMQPQPRMNSADGASENQLDTSTSQPRFTASSSVNNPRRHQDGSYKCAKCDKVFPYNPDCKSNLRSRYLHDESRECGPHQENGADEAGPGIQFMANLGLRPFRCDICRAEFGVERDLQQHECHDRTCKELECPFCSDKFSDPSLLREHVKINHARKVFKCDICKKGFNHKGNLIRHLQIHSGEKPFHCLLCSMKFIQKSVRDSHLLTHISENPQQQRCHIQTCQELICPFCSEKFSHPYSLREHLPLHTRRKTLECEICNKRFHQKIDLVRHLRIHSGEKPFPCLLCSMKFNQKSVRNSHLLTHISENAQQQRCHIQTFQELICPFCSEKFSGPYSLREHLPLHTRRKTFECEICNKRFHQKIDLVRHLRIHSGEKPFQCRLCSKTFTRKPDLARHGLIHTDEKSRQCEFCSKNFRRKDNLMEHRLTHTGEKPHQCHLCSEKFRDRRSLKKHIQKNHSDEKEVYCCDICPVDFTNAENLERHRRIHEPKSSNNDADVS